MTVDLIYAVPVLLATHAAVAVYGVIWGRAHPKIVSVVEAAAQKVASDAAAIAQQAKGSIPQQAKGDRP
jgi:hypothetical protein